MSEYDWLVAAMWVAWLVYWRLAARGVKAAQRKESSASRAAFVVPVIVAVVLLFPQMLPGGFLCGRFLPAGTVLTIFGTAVVAAGLAFSVWARVHLGRNWSGTVTLKQDHELIRSGPYRFVRHPIYTGLLFAFAGTAVVRGEWRGLLAVAFFLAAVWRKSRLEERWLGELFGDAYARYRAEVAALIPWLL
jgi:protein-S-isoprenylcysteine O-methyltransferase Ste14